MKKLAFLPVFAFVALTLAFAQNDFSNVAMINLTKQKPITLKMLKEEVSRMEQANGRPLSDNAKMGILESMINQELFIQAAERDRLTVSDAELNEALAAERAQASQALGRRPSDSEYDALIQQQTGMSPAAYREYMRKGMLARKYVFSRKLTNAIASDLVSKNIIDSAKSQELLKSGAKIQDVVDSLKAPTDADINAYYEEHKMEAIQPATLTVTMLLVPFGRNKNAARTEADNLSAQINGSAVKFDELVRQAQTAARNGNASSLPYRSGNIPYLPRNEQGVSTMGLSFMDEVFKLEQGKISKVLESLQGYAIVKVIASYPEKNPVGLMDEYPVGSGITMTNFIRQGLRGQRERTFLELITEAAAKDLRGPNDKNIKIYKENIKW